MSIRKKLFSALMLFLFVSCLSAQNTNSPYSRFGLGSLENPTLGKNRAMGGVGYGIRDNTLVNPLNPASYSAVDTVNFVFDFGVSSSVSVFSQDNQNQVNPNGRFDFLAIKIPLKKYWGLSVGIMPYSSVGYSYYIDRATPRGETDYTETHVGTGGLNTLFLGSGILLGKHLSLGANLKYVFGSISYNNSILYDNSLNTNLYEFNSLYLGTTSLDLGFQYQTPLGAKGKAVLGATYTNASNFSLCDNQQASISPSKDTIITTTHNDFSLPSSFGIGASYTYDNRLTIGMDCQYQAWSKASINGVKDSMSNSNRFALGVEYLPQTIATNYLKAIKYRFGVQYGDTYYKFSDGNIKNAGLSVGFGLPLRGQKTALNFSFEAGKLLVPSSCPIKENYYKVSLDVTFNEMWFLKRKL